MSRGARGKRGRGHNNRDGRGFSGRHGGDGGGGRGGGARFGGYGAGSFSNYYGPPPAQQEGARPFSLWDEARNTERQSADRSSSRQHLRHMKVTFISAGKLEPFELLKPMMAEKKDLVKNGVGIVPNVPPVQLVERLEDEAKIIEDVQKLDLESTEPPKESSDEQQEGFVFDFTGDEGLAAKARAPTRLPPGSPSPDSSDSEKIVFVPKKAVLGAPCLDSARRVSPPTPKATNVSPKPPATGSHTGPSRSINVTTAERETTIMGELSKEKVIARSPLPAIEPDFNGQRSTKGNKRRRGKGRRGRRVENREAMNDYLANVADDAAGETSMDGDGILGSFKARDLGGDDWTGNSSTDEDQQESDDGAIRRYDNNWLGDDLDDFNTDQGLKGEVDVVLQERARPSGSQYLVKWSGRGVGEATWVPANTLGSTAADKIKAFNLSIPKLPTPPSPSSSEFSDTEEECDDDDDGDDDGDDDDDDTEIDEVADAHLARMLQNQEELSIADVDDMTSEIMNLDDDFFPLSGQQSKGRGKKARQRRRATLLEEAMPNPRKGHFPSASRAADAFDELDQTEDLMDWQQHKGNGFFRDSLPAKASRRKQKAISNLAHHNSELEADLQVIWAKDREKKKSRKILREELRAQGMLTKKAKKSGQQDLTAVKKLQEGMTLEQVWDEVLSFMMRDHSTVSLPPMSKYERKCVHTTAAKLGLKTKSIGTGNSRFPVLYKTPRSGLLEGDFESVESIIRLGKSSKGGDAMKQGASWNGEKSGKSGKNGKSGSTKRDGEVVGAGAQPIGKENRGRLMLEKMGYKPGMTLGAEGSGRGIVEPVLAVIKLSKTGLG